MRRSRTGDCEGELHCDNVRDPVFLPFSKRTISEGQDRVRLMSADSRLRISAILLAPSSNSARRILLSDSGPGNTLHSFISPRRILRIPSYSKTEVVEDKWLCLGCQEEEGQGGVNNKREGSCSRAL